MAHPLLLASLMRVILAVLLVGCTGVITGDLGSTTAPAGGGETGAWESALAAMKTCTSCHSGAGPGPSFLAGGVSDQIEDSLLEYNPSLLDLATPNMSLLVTKGQHEGPPFLPADHTTVLAWIQEEADEHGTGSGTTPAVIVTPPQDLGPCSSTCAIDFDLSALANAPSLPGAHVSFTGSAVGNSLYTTGLAAYGGTSGLYIAHPVFLYLPPSGNCTNGLAPPCPDDNDRFSGMKLDVPAGMPVPFDGGHDSFQDFAPVHGAQIEILFEVLDPYHS